jgi:hypothetical protein
MKMRIVNTLARVVGILLFFAAPSAPRAGAASKGQTTPATACSLTEESTASAVASNQHEQEVTEDAADSSTQESSGISRLLHAWLRMGDAASAQQPSWLSPLVTTSGRIKQELRYDLYRQPGAAGGRVYNFGAGKGLEFLVAPRVQLLLGAPPYTVPTQPGGKSGFGDLPLMMKTRLFSRPQGEGDSVLTLLLGATVPTGGHLYGNSEPVLTPALAFGKGWSRLDVQGTIGGSLPVGGDARLGNQLISNTTLQYRATRLLWPEFEVNATFYESGKYAGKKQVFATPGLGFGRVKLHGRVAFSLGAGVQIATTRFHMYDHRAILSLRLPF